jgi:hypothetical protein
MVYKPIMGIKHFMMPLFEVMKLKFPLIASATLAYSLDIATFEITRWQLKLELEALYQ